ncbi:hypothetical protein E4U43_006797 [Claviceps pusilla]|uniref:Uncharacterized protein n=1 Tax=Claviceps pusilla TaxID=123648 RepID=A0A9P7STC9_9HYPO|nr:hypothetical protein E4U43_006797 [Claviceps pusilla]
MANTFDNLGQMSSPYSPYSPSPRNKSSGPHYPATLSLRPPPVGRGAIPLGYPKWENRKLQPAEAAAAEGTIESPEPVDDDYGGQDTWYGGVAASGESGVHRDFPSAQYVV